MRLAELLVWAAEFSFERVTQDGSQAERDYPAKCIKADALASVYFGRMPMPLSQNQLLIIIDGIPHHHCM